MAELYVVLAPEQMAGFMTIRVFLTTAKAESFIADNPQLRGIIQCETVRGAYSPSAKVFAAHRYLRATDTFDFVGLYSTHDAANAAGGDPSRPMAYDPQ